MSGPAPVVAADRPAVGAAPRQAWAVVAGGGTAGHVLPGLAVAEVLRRRGRGPVHFVGSERGIEARLVPAAGFEVSLLPGRGIQRRLTAENVGAALGIGQAVARAGALLHRLRPVVALCLGGYASVPVGVAALTAGIPVVVAEQNAVPGAANRLLARRAEAAAVSFGGVALPRAVVTGNPVRPEVAALAALPDPEAARRAARAALGVPQDRVVVLVFGGSLGARRLNEATRDLVARWAPRRDVVVRHVVGERGWAAGEAAGTPPGDGLVYQALAYEHAMPEAYLAADVVVSRAGATTVADLAVAGLPAVLVPLPGAPGDHQTANARALVEAGSAVLVPDAEVGGARLAAALDPLVADPARRAAMAAAARSVGRPDAAERVADLLEACAGG